MTSMKSLLAYFLRDRERLFYFEICCCVVLFMAYQLKNKTAIRLRDKLVLPSLAVFVLFLNPVSASFLVNRTDENRATRFFWIAPVTLVLAATTVLLLNQLQKRKIRILAALLIPLVGWEFSNNLPFLNSMWKPSENLYKIPRAIIEICDYIVEDPTAENTAVFPQSVSAFNTFSNYVRQYCPEISTPYAFYNGGGENNQLYYDLNKAMNSQPTDLDTVAQLAVQGGFDYIVLEENDDKVYTGSLSSQGYEEVYRYEMLPGVLSDYGDTDAFVLYRINKEGAAQ